MKPYQFNKKQKERRWIIQDWAGNRVCPNEDFASFEDGWEFVFTKFNEEDYEELFLVLKWSKKSG
tara:strand:+ start:283 stop:477 length:195 start_codon:yes stop_codon:yes gene_type:complete